MNILGRRTPPLWVMEGIGTEVHGVLELAVDHALLFCGVLEDYPQANDVVSFLCTAPGGSALYHDSGVEGGWDSYTGWMTTLNSF